MHFPVKGIGISIVLIIKNYLLIIVSILTGNMYAQGATIFKKSEIIVYNF